MSATSQITTQIVAAVTPLSRMTAWRGLAKSLGLYAAFALVSCVAVTATHPVVLIGGSVLSGLIYASLIILTHDAIHHTLTGWKLYDEWFGRWVGWQGLWLHGTYSELHRLHHKKNAMDLSDPERKFYTPDEARAFGILGRHYARYKIYWDVFVFAGFGMMYGTLREGIKNRTEKRMLGQMAGDVFITVVMYALLGLILYHYGLLLSYLIYFLIVERTAGFIHQMRSHIEHDGLWEKRGDFIQTQLYASRNVRTWGWVGWYFNGLNYHSVHHGFPKVPFYHLREAHHRIQKILNKEQRGLTEDAGYLATLFTLAPTN